MKNLILVLFFFVSTASAVEVCVPHVVPHVSVHVSEPVVVHEAARPTPEEETPRPYVVHVSQVASSRLTMVEAVPAGQAPEPWQLVAFVLAVGACLCVIAGIVEFFRPR